jgi:hypothetical protein
MERAVCLGILETYAGQAKEYGPHKMSGPLGQGLGVRATSQKTRYVVNEK